MNGYHNISLYAENTTCLLGDYTVCFNVSFFPISRNDALSDLATD